MSLKHPSGLLGFSSADVDCCSTSTISLKPRGLRSWAQDKLRASTSSEPREALGKGLHGWGRLWAGSVGATPQHLAPAALLINRLFCAV